MGGLIDFPQAVALAPARGLVLELGVAAGHSFVGLCHDAAPRRVYGFDWFRGLPEVFGDLGIGMFSQDGVPPIAPPNGEFIVGKVEDTLVGFLEQKREPIAFVHFDMDLYGPTRFALDALTSWVIPGTVFAFDEIDGEPRCSQNEQRAFWEWLTATDHTFRFLGRRHHTSWIVQIRGDTMGDLYDALGIRKGASEEDIKAAHRVAVKRTHPDVHGLDSVKEFHAVQQAYEILIDPEKRAAYDATGTIDLAADNKNAQGLRIVADLFNCIMQAILEAPLGQDTITNDLIEVMHDELTSRLGKIAEDIDKAQQTVKRLHKLAGRFKSHTERNVLRGMVENKIELVERAIPQMRESLTRHEAALEILNGQSFEFDAPPPPGPYVAHGLGGFIPILGNFR